MHKGSKKLIGQTAVQILNFTKSNCNWAEI